MPEAFGTMGFLAAGTGTLMEPLRKHTWELVIEDLKITLPAQKVKVPRYEVEPEKIWHFNEATHIAGRPNPGKFSCTVKDVLDPDIVGQLDAWFRLMYNAETGRMSYTNKYKKSGSVYMYDIEGVLVRQWRAVGLFMLGNPVPEELDYKSGESLEVDTEFSCDRCYLVRG